MKELEFLVKKLQLFHSTRRFISVLKDIAVGPCANLVETNEFLYQHIKQTLRALEYINNRRTKSPHTCFGNPWVSPSGFFTVVTAMLSKSSVL